MISGPSVIRTSIAWCPITTLCHQKVYCLVCFHDPPSQTCILSPWLCSWLCPWLVRVLGCVSAPLGGTSQIGSVSSNEHAWMPARTISKFCARTCTECSHTCFQYPKYLWISGIMNLGRNVDLKNRGCAKHVNKCLAGGRTKPVKIECVSFEATVLGTIPDILHICPPRIYVGSCAHPTGGILMMNVVLPYTCAYTYTDYTYTYTLHGPGPGPGPGPCKVYVYV